MLTEPHSAILLRQQPIQESVYKYSKYSKHSKPPPQRIRVFHTGYLSLGPKNLEMETTITRNYKLKGLEVE
jgi:hypothetical protein